MLVIIIIQLPFVWCVLCARPCTLKHGLMWPDLSSLNLMLLHLLLSKQRLREWKAGIWTCVCHSVEPSFLILYLWHATSLWKFLWFSLLFWCSEISWPVSWDGKFYFIHSARHVERIFYVHGKVWRPFLQCPHSLEFFSGMLKFRKQDGERS